VTRGGYYRHSKTEKFLVMQGEVLFKFPHMETGETHVLMTCGTNPQAVDTVLGWTYDITNIGQTKLIYGKLRKYLGEIFHELAKRRGSEIVEGHMIMDCVHMCISIPPKYSVSNAVGCIKGKSAIAIARKFRGKQRNFNGENFWAGGYFVSTMGLDEMMVREYISDQEFNDVHRDQLRLGM
jgi:putative transposase